MKKHTARNVILMAILDVALGIVLSLYIASTGTVPAADNADTYADGAYSASAQGDETPEVGGKAAESLARSLLDAGGTAGVDTVSGATMTSNAVLSAMDACLAQAVQE